jgi:hypothetical protein
VETVTEGAAMFLLITLPNWIDYLTLRLLDATGWY